MKIHQKPTVKSTSNHSSSKKSNSARCGFSNRKLTSTHIIPTRSFEWFRSVMWAKQMHTESTKRSQYFVFKMIMRRLDDERTERDFYSSEDFSLIYIVYSNFRMNRLKSMTQRVWNIIIITSFNLFNLFNLINFCNSFTLFTLFILGFL